MKIKMSDLWAARLTKEFAELRKKIDEAGE